MTISQLKQAMTVAEYLDWCEYLTEDAEATATADNPEALIAAFK